METKVNVGLVGYGIGGEVFHAPILQALPEFHLHSVVERTQAKSKARYPWVQICRSFESLLQLSEIELVIITTPNEAHYPMVKEALEAGKHVVVDKPFVISSEEADELCALARRKGNMLSVYHNRRWDGDFQTIRKLVSENKLGQITYYEAHFDRFRPQIKAHSWREEGKPGSGITYDLGSHLLDQALVLFGKPHSLKAEIKRQRSGGIADDYFRITLIYPGMQAVLTAGMLVENHSLRYIVEGNKGRYIKYGIDPQEEMLKKGIYPPQPHWGEENSEYYGILYYGDKQEVIPSLAGNYLDYYRNIAQAIRWQRPLEVQCEEAALVIRLIELAFESERLGKEILL